MNSLWPILAIVLFIWLMTRRRDRRTENRPGPDARDEAIAKLSKRVRVLEEIITDRDWRLRRDFDGL